VVALFQTLFLRLCLPGFFVWISKNPTRFQIISIGEDNPVDVSDIWCQVEILQNSSVTEKMFWPILFFSDKVMYYVDVAFFRWDIQGITLHIYVFLGKMELRWRTNRYKEW